MVLILWDQQRTGRLSLIKMSLCSMWLCWHTCWCSRGLWSSVHLHYSFLKNYFFFLFLKIDNLSGTILKFTVSFFCWFLVTWRLLAWWQDRLHNLKGPVKNENVGQKLLRMLRWQQQSVKPSAGPFWAWALCDCTGHMPMKSHLPLVEVWGGDILSRSDSASILGEAPATGSWSWDLLSHPAHFQLEVWSVDSDPASSPKVESILWSPSPSYNGFSPAPWGWQGLLSCGMVVCLLTSALLGLKKSYELQVGNFVVVKVEAVFVSFSSTLSGDYVVEIWVSKISLLWWIAVWCTLSPSYNNCQSKTPLVSSSG